MVEPQIYLDQSFHTTTQDSWWKGRRLLIIAAATLIIAEVLWAGYTLTRPFTAQDKITSSTASSKNGVGVVKTVSTAKIALVGPVSAKVGDNLPVNINVNSSVSSDGVDVIIKYDPKLLSIADPKTPVTVDPNSPLLPSYPVNSVDESTGIITISAISPGGPGFKGQSLLGTINFIAKSSGNAKLSIDFTPKLTTDSNVIEIDTGNDILESVDNLEVKIN